MGAEEAEFPLVVAVGASAGGVEALVGLMSALPQDFPAPVLIVMHVAPAGTSVLPQILSRHGPLVAHAARDGEPLAAGKVYVAPPDLHLLLDDSHVKLGLGPRENGHRPAVDPMFRGVAAAFGPRAVGVVLSGTRDDGAAGLVRIKSAGGFALVQDPSESLYDGMPRSAMASVDVDAVLPVAGIAEELYRLATRPVKAEHSEVDPAPNHAHNGEPTRFICPDCGGALFEVSEGPVIQYRCSVGHGYSEQSLESEQARNVEYALWAAVRSLDDRADLLEELATRVRDRGGIERRFSEEARQMRARAELIRRTIVSPAPEADVV